MDRASGKIGTPCLGVEKGKDGYLFCGGNEVGGDEEAGDRGRRGFEPTGDCRSAVDLLPGSWRCEVIMQCPSLPG
jgi:hypothetical protein